jgi:hypothetical protein
MDAKRCSSHGVAREATPTPINGSLEQPWAPELSCFCLKNPDRVAKVQDRGVSPQGSFVKRFPRRG